MWWFVVVKEWKEVRRNASIYVLASNKIGQQNVNEEIQEGMQSRKVRGGTDFLIQKSLSHEFSALQLLNMVIRRSF